MSTEPRINGSAFMRLLTIKTTSAIIACIKTIPIFFTTMSPLLSLDENRAMRGA